ncbi:MAG TPA: Uma2 family endonuclease, partial [Pyrinomonadaceae bacterium]|nr:Uma2 family endonuclease [Pyrinomonadaceae bacterium]
DELLKLPRGRARYELVKGELMTTELNGAERGAVAARLMMRLGRHIKEHQPGVGFAAGGFLLATDPDTVRAADIAFVRREKIPERDITEKYRPGAPDLVVEVLSPEDSFDDVSEKVDGWPAAGALAVWIVSPKRRNVTVYRSLTDVTVLSEADELDGGEVVPGFRCRVAEIFV